MVEYFNPLPAKLAVRREPGFWLSLVWNFAIAVLGVMGMGLLAGTIWYALSPALGGASPAFELLALAALLVAVRSARRNRALIAAGYLEQALRLNLPLPAMIRAAELSERGRLRRTLRELRTWVEMGAPVGTALERSMPGVPPRIVLVTHCAERLGQLPRALRQLLGEDRAPAERRAMQSIMVRWYPIVMLVALAAVSLVLNVFIMPKYRQILRDFHLPMPLWSSRTIAVWEWLEFPIAAIAALVLVDFVARTLSEVSALPRRMFGPWRAIGDRVAWVTPVWGTMVRAQGLADVFRLLADATEAGLPLDRSLCEASDACVNRVLENRISRWSQFVSAGVPAADAARRARLPALVVGMVGTAQGTAAAPAVFSFLARYYEGRHARAAALLQAAAIPAIVLPWRRWSQRWRWRCSCP